MARVGHTAKEGRPEARGAGARTSGARGASRGGSAPDASRTPVSREERSILPHLPALLDPRSPYLIPILVLLLARIVAWVEIRIPAEDAYITFRYARNLAAGNGLVYNPGERVMGFTSPLWTLWLAAGYALFHDPLPWARVWAILADLGTLVLVVRMLDRQISRPTAWCFALFFAAWPYFSASAVSGMESSAFLFLIALSSALLARRDAWSGAALGALALVRPEGVACAAVLSLWTSWRSRIVALAVASAGAIALAVYYGSPVPQSLVAKSRLYGIAGPWLARHWWEWISPVILGRWPHQGDTALLVPFLLLLAPAFVVGARALWERRTSAAAAMSAACVVVWVGYAALGVAYFWWYLLVPLAGIVVVAAVGFPSIVRGRAIPIAIMLLLASIWSVSRELYVGRAEQEGQSFGQASTELRQRAKPGDHVLLEPIGMIGYYAPVIVIDEVGLVTPRVATRRLQGPGWYADIVNRERPEWLVVRASMVQSGQVFAGAGAPFRNADERQEVLGHYEEQTRTGGPNAGDAALLLLRRR